MIFLRVDFLLNFFDNKKNHSKNSKTMAQAQDQRPGSPTTIMEQMDVGLLPVIPQRKADKRNIRFVLEKKRINKILDRMFFTKDESMQ
jgi:hypothetical protein